MAIPGNPFYTVRLDRQRSRQRKLLRSLDKATIVAANFYTRAANIEEDDPDRGLLESELRRLVDVETEGLHDVLGQIEGVEAAKALNALLDGPGRRRDASLDPLHPLRAPTRIKAGEGFKDETARERGADLARLAAFLIWADEVADDGYRDPRASRPQLEP